MPKPKGAPDLPADLLRGARELAKFIYGNPGEYKKIYRLKRQLALFKLNGVLAGRRSTIMARIAAAEDASAD
jgi:hypothetical protein